MGPVAMALLAELAAPAAGAPVDLDWRAPEGCPERDEIEDRVMQALGPYERARTTTLTARVVIEHEEDRYVLDLQLGEGGQPGRRRLEGSDCTELGDAVALIVAIAIDPRVLDRISAEQTVLLDETSAGPIEGEQATSIVPEPTEAPADSPRAEPPPEQPAEPRPQPAPSTEPTPSPRQSPPRLDVKVGLDVFAGVGLELLPDPTAVVGAAVALSGRLWRTELGFKYWTPADKASPSNPDVGGRFQLWAVAPRGCVAPGVGTVELPICVGFDLGAMHGRGTGELDPSRNPAVLWAAFAGGAGARWSPRRLGDRVGFWAHGEALVALARADFVTEQSGVIFGVPGVGGQVVAGVEARLR